ncbi:MAG: hypothetical protein H7X91_10960 [Burkholderiales bacterium]|nr:hypothetical protein [Burkholderiales bacterium]
MALTLGLLLLTVFEFTDLDQRLSTLFYEPAQEAFPLRHNWFIEVVLHHWAKYLLVVFGLAMLGGFALSFRLAPLCPLHAPML